MAGLLSGGVVAVPVLLKVHDAIGIFKETSIIMAVSTARACILVASLTARLADWRDGTVDRILVRAWLPALTRRSIS